MHEEFIIQPNGEKAFGRITAEIEKTTDGELKQGEIRLRVGNEHSGFIHAMKHNEQAKDNGYSSIIELIEDVSQNYDEIYRRDPKDEHKKPSYTLIKRRKGDERNNAIESVYFEIQPDGKDNYYVVIGALPKRDRSVKKGIKNEHLIYSRAAVAPTAVSGDSAVSAPVNNKAGVERDGLPTSDKSSVPADNVAQKEDEGNLIFTLPSEGSLPAVDAFAATAAKSEKGQAQILKTLNVKVNYNGRVETRREHIERLFKEHPDYQAMTYIRVKGTQDIYISKQTDYQIYHSNMDNLKEFFKKFWDRNNRFPTSSQRH